MNIKHAPSIPAMSLTPRLLRHQQHDRIKETLMWCFSGIRHIYISCMYFNKISSVSHMIYTITVLPTIQCKNICPQKFFIPAFTFRRYIICPYQTLYRLIPKSLPEPVQEYIAEKLYCQKTHGAAHQHIAEKMCACRYPKEGHKTCIGNGHRIGQHFPLPGLQSLKQIRQQDYQIDHGTGKGMPGGEGLKIIPVKAQAA